MIILEKSISVRPKHYSNIMFTICSTRFKVCTTKQYRISQNNSTKWAQSPSSQKMEFDSKHWESSQDCFILMMFWHLSMHYALWNESKAGKLEGEKNGNRKEKREIICSGFTLREALSWMANVAELMPVSTGTSKGLVTFALWRVTMTRKGVCQKQTNFFVFN